MMPSLGQEIINSLEDFHEELKYIESISFWIGQPKFILKMKPDDRKMFTQLVVKYLEKETP